MILGLQYACTHAVKVITQVAPEIVIAKSQLARVFTGRQLLEHSPQSQNRARKAVTQFCGVPEKSGQ